MKTLILAAALFSTGVIAQEWTETFKLPEGTTFRARGVGYDCGTFITTTETYVRAPQVIIDKNIDFKQFAADKDLNKFLIEIEYPGSTGEKCIYGMFLDRDRDNKALNFTHSQLKTAGSDESCLETKDFLDNEYRVLPYEASKRGIRFVAVTLVQDTANEVCESGTVRTVFDRRF